jgi:hypothetical protein
MQIAKHTGWSIEYIHSFNIKEINKMATWAFNQEIVERENLFSVIQWHVGIQHKKSANRSKQNIKKALKKQNYNPKEDKTKAWIDFFRTYSGKAFDKFFNSLK